MSKDLPKWATDSPAPDAAPKKTVDAAAIDKLIAAHRVLGESRMIRTDTPTDQITDEQIAAVIDQVKAYMKARGLSQAQVARSLMIGVSTLSQILSGKYGADPRSIIATMDRWLERRKTADEQPVPFTTIRTDVAQQIRIAAKRAMAAADAGIDARISLVWGDPGCGKTLALQAIAESEDAILITCGIDVNSPRAVLEKIAEALRITIGTSNRIAFGDIVDRLRGSGKLIIIDEIHALLEHRDDQVFHTLRRLSDQTGCPQLWAATCNLIVELQARQRKREPLGQIIRRIGSQFEVTAKLHAFGGRGGGEPLVSVPQVLEMFGKNEIKLTNDAARFLSRFSTNAKLGLLGSMVNIVITATSLNRGKARELSAVMLWEACQFLFQNSVMKDLENSLKEELSEMKLKIA